MWESLLVVGACCSVVVLGTLWKIHRQLAGIVGQLKGAAHSLKGEDMRNLLEQSKRMERRVDQLYRKVIDVPDRDTIWN